MSLPTRFQPALRQVERLARHERYQGAFIFGSVARGEATGQSDFDVKVVTRGADTCAALSHPFIGGVKLDISFQSFDQLERSTAEEIAQGQRVPMLAESLIVFDKTGDLAHLQGIARRAEPKPVPFTEHPGIQFIVYHVNDKVARNLDSDPLTSLLAMHTGLNDLLHIHYRIHRHWQVSSKRLLADLEQWDKALAAHIKRFIQSSNPAAKFAAWSAMIDHVLAPLGGRLPITENTCECRGCRQSLCELLAPC